MYEEMLSYLLVVGAMTFAKEAHEGQTRKYTGEPYIVHPFAVAGLTMSVTDDPEIVIAAYLHDVVEDTETTFDEIEEIFGERVRNLVADLTDVATYADGNRAKRTAINREHTAKAHPDAKTIKLADVCNNLKNIESFDKEFAKVYMAEKKLLLEVLTEGDPTLYKLVEDMINKYYDKEKDLTNDLTIGTIVDKSKARGKQQTLPSTPYYKRK